jgi:uncharacterized protein YqhQ
MTDALRLGGMALANGVLVHGPEHWACAIRDEAGEIALASGRKPVIARDVKSPFIRGPVKMAEMFALLPVVRRALPEARLPYERPDVAAAMLGSAAAIRGLRGSALQPAVRETLAALLAVAPSALALRGSALAQYHGAEHISIGSYERAGEKGTRVHERCGSHLVGPLLVTMAAGNTLASKAPEHLRGPARVAATLGALATSTEVFGWMTRHPESRITRMLAKPGHELQHRLATEEPTSEQLEVAETALAECLRLEKGAAQ